RCNRASSASELVDEYAAHARPDGGRHLARGNHGFVRHSRFRSVAAATCRGAGGNCRKRCDYRRLTACIAYKGIRSDDYAGDTSAVASFAGSGLAGQSAIENFVRWRGVVDGPGRQAAAAMPVAMEHVWPNRDDSLVVGAANRGGGTGCNRPADR